MLGDRNWWMPKWLDRLLPELDVEGHGSDDEDEHSPVQNGHGDYVPRHAANPDDEPEPELV